jgi:nucleotide-binding universal stress UspA family protein
MNRTVDRIVAATDFSSDAGKAVQRAAMLASRQRVDLELLHVVDGTSLDAVREWVRTPADIAERLTDDARRLLDEVAASIAGKAETSVSARLAVGHVLDEILASCAGAAMVVVGAHGLSPLRDAILGTTAERLVGKCGRPILIVRRQADEAYRNVLVPVDLLPGSEDLLAAAAEFAPGARLTAVHAYQVPFEGMLQRAGLSLIEIDKHRAQALRRALAAISKLSQTVTSDPTLLLPVVERGDPARLIIERERSLGADLIVIGKRRRSMVEALLLGSVTRHVLADAEADVLVLQHA